MQKMIYFAYGWTMVAKEKKLFYDRIEAWQYGPVIPSLYDQLKKFGRKRITHRILEFNHEKNKFFSWSLVKDSEVEKIVRKVWDYYKQFSPAEMVNLTHALNTPWYKTVLDNGFYAVISDELISKHFSEKEKRINIIGK